MKPLMQRIAFPIEREAIARRAYHHWLRRGRPHGSAQADWLRAERELADELLRRRADTPVALRFEAEAPCTAYGLVALDEALPPSSTALGAIELEDHTQAGGRRRYGLVELSKGHARYGLYALDDGHGHPRVETPRRLRYGLQELRKAQDD